MELNTGIQELNLEENLLYSEITPSPSPYTFIHFSFHIYVETALFKQTGNSYTEC